jgi:hypothetical protein
MFDPNPLHHRCRNARCKIWLKEPVENRRNAFCCASCEVGFYRTHCRVCEKELGETKRNSRRELCGKRKCINEFRSDRKRAQLVTRWYPLAVTSKPEKSLTKSTLKPGIKSDRGFAIGRDYDREVLRDNFRANAKFWNAAALIGPNDPPVNILGVHRWSNSVAVDREALAGIIATEIDGFGETVMPVVASDWKPCAPSSPITDDPSIPFFMRRRP